LNPGGEPERDETGLPPVDIEIPDDARELDRDVQAYHRELRAQRRLQRGQRVRGTLARDGIVLPLLACCLILALITGTVLTVFTATSDRNPYGFPAATGTSSPPAASRHPSGGTSSAVPSSPPASSPPASSTGSAVAAHPPPATVPGRLPPGATIAVDGRVPSLVHELSRTALVLVPSHCDCTATISWLIYVVTNARAQPYLVYTAATKSEVEHLYMSLSSSDQAKVLLAAAADNTLRESIPDTLPEDGLAAILLGPKAVVYATGLAPRDNATTLIEALNH
jgi:hypothetical protein